MDKISDTAWLDWRSRFKAHVKRSKIGWESVASKLNLTTGAVRHRLNTTRNVKLDAFFRMCAAANADPAMILFGRPLMTEEKSKELHEFVAKWVGAQQIAPLEIAQRNKK